MSDYWELPDKKQTATTTVSSGDFEVPGKVESKDIASQFETPKKVTPVFSPVVGKPSFAPTNVTIDPQQIAAIVKSAPDPARMKEIIDQTLAIQSLFGVSIDEAAQQAKAIADSPKPETKRLGRAIADRFTYERISTQMAQVANAARKAIGDPERYKQLMADYDALEAKLPALADVAPAYPDNFLGKIRGFLRSIPVETAGLLGQQAEIIAGDQSLKDTEAQMQAMGLTDENWNDLPKSAFASALGQAALSQARTQVAQGQVMGKMYFGTADIEAGTAFMEMVKNGVDPTIADTYAKGIGAINNVLELAQFATFVKMFPGADQVFSKAAESLATKAVIGPLLRNAAIKATAKLAVGTAEQLAQEVAQEAVTFYGENMATELQNAVKGTALEGNKDFLKRAGELVKQALPGFLGMGLLPVSADVVKSVAERAGVKATPSVKPEVAPAAETVAYTEQARKAIAETPEAAPAAVEQIATQQASDMAKADKLTPQMINEAEELANLQDEATQTAEVAPVAEPAPVTETAPEVTGETWYHGTRNFAGPASELRPGVADLGVYMTKDRGYAESYNDPNFHGDQGSPNVIEIAAAPKKTLETRFGLADPTNVAAVVDELKNSMDPDAMYYDRVARKLDSAREGFLNAKTVEEWAAAEAKLYDSAMDISKAKGGNFVSVAPLRDAMERMGYDSVRKMDDGYDTLVALDTSILKDAPKANDVAQSTVESGGWIDDTELGQFIDQDWAKEELTARNELRDEATLESETGQATDFETFLANITGMEPDPKSEEYYRNIWDTSRKAEVKLDPETQTVDTDAVIDTAITAEAKRAEADAKFTADIDTLAGTDLAVRDIFDDAETARNALKDEMLSEEPSFEMDPEVQKVNAQIEDLQQQVKDAKEQGKADLAAQKEHAAAALANQKADLTAKIAEARAATKAEQAQSKYALRYQSATAKLEKQIAVEKAVAKEKGKLAEYKDALKRKGLVKKMIRDILKKPSGGIGFEAVQKIRDLQAPYTAKSTKGLAKAQGAIKEWASAHPGEAIPAEAQAILDRTGIKDLTLNELVDLWKTQKDIREQGAIAEKERRQKTKERRVQLATDLLADIPGGYLAERSDAYGSETTQQAEKKLAKKGFLKFNMEHPLRLFKDMGPTFEKVFWDNRKNLEGKEVTRQSMHDREIKALYDRTGVTPREMLRKLPGTDYYIDTLMYYYGQMQDPDGRRAVLWGNDEEEATITRAVAQLPQKFKDFIDGYIDLANKHYADVEKVGVEVDGRAAPKVERYLPIKREQDAGQAMAQELSTEANIRAGVKVASTSKGFTNQRVKFKEQTQQPRIRTDLLNIMVEQVTKESRYVVFEEWARDMAWLLGGKSQESKRFLEAVKQAHGKNGVQFLQDYVNAVIRPEAFNGTDAAGVISRVFRGMNDAALMYKLGTILVQVEGPFRTLSQLNVKQWPYVLSGLWKASTQSTKAAEFMYEKSPVMKSVAEAEAIDPALQEGRSIERTKTDLGMTVQLARKAMQQYGYAGLSFANKWTTTAEWTAVYQAEMKRTGDEKAAIKAADDAIFLNQPSGKLADAPRMYWTAKKNILLSYLMRFSRASNQMAQMLGFDLPKNIKKGEVGKAAGILMVFALGATLNGIRQRKRLPESPDELKEDAISGLSDSLGAMTYGAGSAVVSGFTGEGRVGEIKPLESAYQAGNILKDAVNGNISEKDIWKLISLAGQMGGLPIPAAENVVRSVYDTEEERFRFDPVELFGRRPRE